MKTIILECPICFVEFSKPLKEYNRQRNKRSDYPFYCSRRCTGKAHHSHLQEYIFEKGNRFQKEGCEKAALVNTKYTPEDRPYYSYLSRCNKRLHDCTVTVDYLKQLWDTQNGRCAISNIPIAHASKDRMVMASLDRKDSTKGYIEGNVQYVAYAINLAKNNFPDEDAHRLMSLICENYLTIATVEYK